MQSNPQEQNSVEWTRKAHDDELNARSILKHRDGTPNGVCFMSHQMAEKYLKAYLVEKKNWFPKVHPLDALLEECMQLDPSFEELKDDSLFLSTFYISTRYPGDYPEFGWSDAEDAFAAATRIKSFITVFLPKRLD